MSKTLPNVLSGYSCYCSRIPFSVLHYVYPWCLLRLFSDFPRFDDLDNFKEYLSGISVEGGLIWVCLTFFFFSLLFSWLGWDCTFLKGRPQRQSAVLITSCPDTCFQHDSSMSVLALITYVAEVPFPRFLCNPVKSPSSSLSIPYSLEASHRVKRRLFKWEFYSSSPGQIIFKNYIKLLE